MNFSRIKKIFTSVNEKTNDTLTIMIGLSTWAIITCLLFYNGYGIFPLPPAGVAVNEFATFILIIVLHGLVYMILSLFVALVLGSIYLIVKSVVKIVKAFKEAIKEEFKIASKPNKQAKITF